MFKTRLKCETPVSFGLIKVSKDGQIKYVENVKHNSPIDVVVDPFEHGEARFFLFVYLPERLNQGENAAENNAKHRRRNREKGPKSR